MPGLFDELKEATFGIFAGPTDSRLPEGTGRREGLIQAGLATIASGNQDPLEAIAIGAMAGREASQSMQEQKLLEQNRMALQEYMMEAGYTRESLSAAAFKSVAAGDLEVAKGIFEVIKSLPQPQAGVNTRMLEVPARALPGGAPEGVDPEAMYQVPQDPRTLQTYWGQAMPMGAEDETIFSDKFTEPNAQSPTGAYRIGIRRDTGAREILGLADPGGGDGGALGQVNRSLSAGILQDLDQAYNPILADLPTDMKVRLSQPGANPGWFRGTVAAAANASLSPEEQATAAAAARVTGITQRIMSGAQMSDAERQFYRAAFGVVGGDHSITIEQKKQAVRLIAEGLGGGGSLEEVAARAEDMASTEQGREQLANIIRDAGRSVGITYDGSGGGGGGGGGLPEWEPGRNR